MLQKGSAKPVAIFVNGDAQHRFGPLTDAVLILLLHTEYMRIERHSADVS